ncbi:DUF2069 domain-containing protein [Pseudoalteromonas sp. MMG013]|uniref:DUF2069 domain-containing protein n=1 Tax=Pseudoalteromonas aurantia 208 TaxID=1314867 RepID=A0ABR9E919_9GAMM|nr:MULTISPECIES: DUF2069 domain-containing protein [Pseudoalteromonas]MBE0367482.1 hypothetical protein [Pseudoalteromonas aurantia 208]MBQ4845852.1 DUF2069 domain-containing protein [Pseudoalteromonas sp. MMG005]MBQ4849106.1 DUF2069 domain-containing protein [Pseudoalteromonas sp. MMG012]MBQ4861889.1 DUF2069 domain-containing protein [Pseudoalteromonas sp. MMG013]
MKKIAKNQVTLNYQRLALTGYIGLLLLMPIWMFVLVPKENYSTGFIFTIYILPLLLPLKGIIQDKPYTYAWANFIVMIYFMHSLTMIWIAPEQRIIALLELLLATAMFVGCTYYARHRGQELGLKIRKLKEDLADEKQAHQAPKE